MGKNKCGRIIGRDEEEEDGDHQRYNNKLWRRFIKSLDFHQWQYLSGKKMLHRFLLDNNTPIRRSRRRRRKRWPHDDHNKIKLLQGDEAQAMEDEEEESHSQVIPFLNNKTSLRARIKAFIVEHNNNGNRNNYKQLSKSQPKSDDDEEPAEVFPGNSNKNSKTLQDDNDEEEEEEEEEEITHEENQNLIKDDDFEHELFLIKIMQDQLNSSRKTRLTKSGSFPCCDSKRGMFKPLQLKDKHSEIWHSAKRSSGILANDDEEEEKCHKNAEIEDNNEKSGRKLAAHRRSASLNESLERYSRLYEHSFGKERKLIPSKSLKVVPFTRTRSLSNVESIFSLQIETLDGAPFSYHPTGKAEDSSSYVNIVTTDTEEEKQESGKRDASVGGNEAATFDGILNANADDEIDHDMKGLQQEVSSDEIILSNLDSSVLETCFQEQLSTPEDSQIAKEEHEYRESKMTDDPDLSYVMDILECSGFTQNFFQGKWHSRDQPLSPSAMEKVEARWHNKEDREDEDLCNQHHKMLFDLMNEVCVEIYDRSFPYYPAALSSSCKIRSLPTGNHIIQEVCSSVSSWLSLKPEMKQTLDCIVGRDIEKGYGWMNLQLESEFVALEVEDMVFDDVLDEILFYFSSTIP